ncbi:hypothetical protein [Shewanella sp. T24-MNA-CIBAN-0130]|uniref:hypothetical protein n=1 Tax=Shewanella sp. T24-MNA-CIBAN-0130 TaxID=3140470 RepID=UPI0033225EE5
MNEGDIAAKEADAHLSATINNHRSTKYALPVMGNCHNCYEPIAKPKLFCDDDCCIDFEKRKRMNIGKSL